MPRYVKQPPRSRFSIRTQRRCNCSTNSSTKLSYRARIIQIFEPVALVGDNGKGRRNRSQARHCCNVFMNARTPGGIGGQAVHPLDTVDIGQSRHRFAGGALFRKRQTGLSSFRLLYDCAGVGRPRLDPKRGGPPGPSGGETIATVTFSIESSLPVDTERAMLDSLRSVYTPVREIPRRDCSSTRAFAFCTLGS